MAKTLKSKDFFARYIQYVKPIAKKPFRHFIFLSLFWGLTNIKNRLIYSQHLKLDYRRKK